jgi:extradiol dioxygenase family protein
VINPFHLAIKVRDLAEAREFYGGLLGCAEGRSDSTWVDFNMMGHQLVCHLAPETGPDLHANPVDGHDVPVPHFGVVLDMESWRALAAKLKAANVRFVIEPYIRFEGEPGEQATMFFLDPSGNPLEFKAFDDIDGQLFATGKDNG